MGAPDQIDAMTYELSLLNDLMAAKQEYRVLDAIRQTKPAGSSRHVANIEACNALARVLTIEAKLDDLRRVP